MLSRPACGAANPATIALLSLSPCPPTRATGYHARNDAPAALHCPRRLVPPAVRRNGRAVHAKLRNLPRAAPPAPARRPLVRHRRIRRDRRRARIRAGRPARRSAGLDVLRHDPPPPLARELALAGVRPLPQYQPP